MPAHFQLPEPGAAESPALDFKAKGEDKSGEADFANKLACQVAAMANALGGELVVGAVHDRSTGRLKHYAPFGTEQEAQARCRAYDEAVRDLCYPPPIFAVEAPRQKDSGWVVVVHVTAYPGQAVGVRVGKKADDVPFRFPVRVGTQTTYFPPERLPMLMSADVRRMAILLNAIPAGEKCVVRQFLSNGAPHLLDDVFMVAVEELTNSVRFKLPSGAYRSIPLDHVQTVYFKEHGAVWSVVVRCFE